MVLTERTSSVHSTHERLLAITGGEGFASSMVVVISLCTHILNHCVGHFYRNHSIQPKKKKDGEANPTKEALGLVQRGGTTPQQAHPHPLLRTHMLPKHPLPGGRGIWGQPGTASPLVASGSSLGPRRVEAGSPAESSLVLWGPWVPPSTFSQGLSIIPAAGLAVSDS